jgi:hypothetical protein
MGILLNRIAATLKAIEEAGTFKQERVITTMQNAEVRQQLPRPLVASPGSFKRGPR